MHLRRNARTARMRLLLAGMLLLTSGVLSHAALAAAPLFSDGFESGNFSAWTQVVAQAGGSATVQTSAVHDGTYAARFSETSADGSVAYARKSLSPAQTDVTVDGYFDVLQEGASGSNVPLLRLFDSNGTRQLSVYRQNHWGGQVWVQHSGGYGKTSGTLALGAWARVTVHVIANGSGASTLDVSLNGKAIYHSSTASLGASIATLQIGNDTNRQTFALAADTLTVTGGSGGGATAPDTTITGGPSGTVNATSASFTFTATAPATFTCQLDGGAAASCASPKSYSNLADGAHTFSVFATDSAGNADPTPATRSWTISSGPTLLFSDGFESGNFSAWTSVRADGGGSATVQTSVTHDGNDAARLAATSATNSYAFARKTLASAQTDLTVDGYFLIQQEGVAGSNVPLLRLFDNSTREVSVYRQNQRSDQIWVEHSGGYAKTSGTLPLNTWAELTVHVVTQGSDAGLLDVALNGTQIYHTTTADLDGSIDTLQLGNDTQRQTFTLIADTITATSAGAAPLDTTITGGPSGTDSSSSASFSFTSTQPGATFECKLDSGSYGACTSPQSYSGLADGAHSFAVRAIDASGNADPTPATRSWTVDTTGSGGGGEFAHIMVIILENRGYDTLNGDSSAPFINSVLNTQYASATHMYVPYHNSVSAYLELASGRTYMKGDGGDWSGSCLPSRTCSTTDMSVMQQLNESGRTWKVYSEDQDVACQTYNAKKYWVTHNPAVFYQNLGPNSYVSTGNGTCLTSDVNYNQLKSDISSGNVPDLMFVVPNNCDNMHDSCSPLYDPIKQGDTWLQQQLAGDATVPGGLIQWAQSSDTLLIITFDEAESTDHQTCCPYGTAGGGGHIPTWVIGPAGKVRSGGYEVSDYMNLISIFKTIEENWSFPMLYHANDTNVPDLSSFMQ